MQANIASARKVASRLLLSQSLKSLFVNVPQLRYDRQITFASMQEFCQQTRVTLPELLQNSGTQDGCTLICQDRKRVHYTILYNNEQSPRRTSFTLAHEIGHIYLDHQSDSPVQEREADAFAAQLLLPTIFLFELYKKVDLSFLHSIVYDTFNISQYAAKRSLWEIRKANKLSFSQEDYALLHKYGSLLPSMDEPIITLK